MREPRHSWLSPPAWRAGLALAILAGLWLAGLGLFHHALLPVSTETKTQLVRIEKSSLRALSEQLQRAGLIRSAWAFRLWARAQQLRHPTQQPRAGYYDLSPSMSAPEIWLRLCRGEVARRKITFPEGFTLAQMAERIERVLHIPARDFLRAAQGRHVTRAVPFPLPRGSLEGYLFPSTYTFEVGAPPELLVSEMLAVFDRVFYEPHKEEIARRGRSLHEIVIIASLVEREARAAHERPLIAGVIMNRLARGMRLEIDAAILYALGRHKRRVTYADLRIDSPFNTYRHKGLPPGPICNPGLACLRAALRPARTEALFYVAKPDGTHIFSRTYEEHLQAIKRIRG